MTCALLIRSTFTSTNVLHCQREDTIKQVLKSCTLQFGFSTRPWFYYCFDFFRFVMLSFFPLSFLCCFCFFVCCCCFCLVFTCLFSDCLFNKQERCPCWSQSVLFPESDKIDRASIVEFIEQCVPLKSQDKINDEIAEAFAKFETCEDFVISKADFRDILTKLGDEPLTESEADSIIDSLDQSTDKVNISGGLN